MTPRAVFDCMVFLQGAGRPAGPAACLRLVDEVRITLCVCAEILAEVRDVLTRPETPRRFPGLSAEWAESFVEHLELKGVLFADVPHAVRLQRAPEDEPYVNLAIAAGAKYLVSRDLDLLDLMKDDGFRRRYPGLLILEPVALLREIAVSRQGEDDAGRP
jgi:putative PIN family toxin of toxin-antitoxin system